ncbi:hypothetical protein [Acinetobacter baumannii]|uniref:hypothetical protein n=1 Tax=Acinetobacter baumannii TaxID=470 RepID=UPI00386CF332
MLGLLFTVFALQLKGDACPHDATKALKTLSFVFKANNPAVVASNNRLIRTFISPKRKSPSNNHFLEGPFAPQLLRQTFKPNYEINNS